MIKTSLRRLEVERKSYLASRPVFLLDQILHLVWLERTTVKYNTYKIVTFHPLTTFITLSNSFSEYNLTFH